MQALRTSKFLFQTLPLNALASQRITVDFSTKSKGSNKNNNIPSSRRTSPGNTFKPLSLPWEKALELKRLVLHEPELTESFVKGSGKGGQKINKVRNCVALTHVPTGTQIQCQKTRNLEDNRRIARKRLLEKLDDLMNGKDSKRNRSIKKLQKKKASRAAKSRKKHGITSNDEDDEVEALDEYDEEEYDEEEEEEEEEMTNTTNASS